MILKLADLSTNEIERLDKDNIKRLVQKATDRLNNPYLPRQEIEEIKEQITEYRKMLEVAS